MVLKSWIRAICSTAMLFVARYISLWFIIGSFHLFFSGTTFFGSLSGLYISPSLLALWFIPSLVHSMYYKFTFSLQLLSVYHISTQLAAWYWHILELKEAEARGNKYQYICAGIPLVCMALFMWHPVGWQAAPYSFYWLIPAFIVALPVRNRWLVALGSTLTAHAVGSVLWIWTHPGMLSSLWLGLIPVVAYERFMLATGMWVMSHILDVCIEKLVEIATSAKLQVGGLWGALRGEVVP